MSKETKQTNLDEAKESLESIIRMVKNGGISPDNKSLPFNFEIIRSRALIAIAEQLRVANLIAIGSESGKPGTTLLDNSADSYSYDFAPDIAAILGLGDDHE